MKMNEIWCECNIPKYDRKYSCLKCKKRLESFWWHSKDEKWFWKNKPSRRKYGEITNKATD